MGTKEYLKQVERLNKDIENKSEEIQKLKDLATRITSNTENERVQENGSQDKIGDSVAGILDLERELKKMVDDSIEKRRVITKQIEELDDVIYYDVLYKRYILCKQFHVIATDLTYNMEYLFRVHRKALRAFERKHGETYLEKEVIKST